MHLWIRLCMIGALAFVAEAGHRAHPPSSNTLAAWAMPAHDPQRTAQGIAAGPHRASAPQPVPHGLFSDPPIIGRDGTVYGFLDLEGRRDVAAMDPQGRIRWTAFAGRPSWAVPEVQPYPVLTPDGSIFFTGGACARPTLPADEVAPSPGCLSAVGPDGRLRWHQATDGLMKSGLLLVRPDGSLVRATIGPPGAQPHSDAILSITIYTLNGATRRLGASCSWAATALGAGMRLYAATAAGGSDTKCAVYRSQSHQDSSSVVAFTAGGQRAWMTLLPVGCSADALAVDLTRGLIYVAAACTTQRNRAQSRVYALDATGRRRWVAYGRGGAPALALDRRSGDLWIADNVGLQRLSSSGATRWHVVWRATPGNKEVLALDAQGAAYIGDGRGLLRVVSPDGKVLWKYQFTSHYGFAYAPPDPAIAADGKLYVSTPDRMVVFAP